MDRTATSDVDAAALADRIRSWGQDLGFQAIGFADIELSDAERKLNRWLAEGYHGEMGYMSRHGSKRSRPSTLIPGTVSVISARLDYLPEAQTRATALLDHPRKAYVSRYALGRDYHKVVRKRLRTLAQRIEDAIGPFGFRVFTDSAPVLEKPLAEKAGLGWIGKHTNVINRRAGSWFFLGEIYTDLALPTNEAATDHCGSCRACIDVCPTDAIVRPYELDARRCISYLTIELKGSIPEALRKPIGNRIYGCDDCQLFCPWNKFAKVTAEADFAARHQLDEASLVELFAWDEDTWLQNTEGSAIRRIGYERWLRNIAVALGNASTEPAVVDALKARLDSPYPLVVEHVQWALRQHQEEQHYV
ncbi:MAG: tRNA epoxyqueuosine(34) reductase QueG [Pseudomonadota bacterium]